MRHLPLNPKLQLASLSCRLLYSLLGLVNVLVSVQQLLGTHLQIHVQLELVLPLVLTNLRLLGTSLFLATWFLQAEHFMQVEPMAQGSPLFADFVP